MKTKPELQELFGNTDPGMRFFTVNLPEGSNPFTDVSAHAQAEVFVCMAMDAVYAMSAGPINQDIATEIA